MYWSYRQYSRVRELLDFIISILVLSFAFSYRYIIQNQFNLIPAVIIAIVTSFALHELAHRSIARANGIYARYKAWYLGLLLALIFAIATQGRFLFAAPGAVAIYSSWYMPEIEALIALAGPVTNIIIGFVCLVLLIPTHGIVYQYIRIIGSINAFIALFNSLPLPPLDGYRVFKSSIIRWVVIFLFSIFLWIIYWFS